MEAKPRTKAELDASVDRCWRELAFDPRTIITLDRDPVASPEKPGELVEFTDVMFGRVGDGAHFLRPYGMTLDEKKQLWIDEAAKRGHVVEIVPHPNYQGRFAFKVKA